MVVITVTNSIALMESELRFDYVRSSGPGGQNVNKVSSAVQMRFDARNSPSLPGRVKARLFALAGRRATTEGEILIEAQRFREQEKNRRDAIHRLIELIKEAAVIPKKRRPTRPTFASKTRRLESKRIDSQVKHFRKSPSDE